MTRCTLLIVLCIILLAGCGVPKDEHAAKLKELANAQALLDTRNADLANSDKALLECRQREEETQQTMESLGEEKDHLSKEKTELTASNTALKELLDKIKKANEKRKKAMGELLAKFAELIQSGKLSIGVNDGRMVIQLPADVMFKVGKSKLSKAGRRAVKDVAEVLKTIEGRKFQVAGHTDDQRGRSRVNPNWTLSYKRARSVFDILVKTDKKLEPNLSLAAYAEYSPVSDNDSKEGQKKNRRIEIVLLPTSDELPLKQLMKIKKVQNKIDDKAISK